MQRCPECLTQYEDNIKFCANDGKSLVADEGVKARLCPHCANSIAEQATRCPYCKAELRSSSAQQWPARENDPEERSTARKTAKSSKSAKAVLVAGLALFLFGAFFIGKSMLTPSDRGEFASLVEEKVGELQEKEQKIKALEDQLAQLRRESEERSNESAQLRARLDDSQKDLTSTRQKLDSAQREIDRLASTPRPQAGAIPAPRAPEPRSPEPPPSIVSRRPADPGLYEAIRPTSVYEEPSATSRVLSKIKKGTKVTVVRSVGDWLEVRSKHGNPPGFVLRDDAMFVR